jgi:O-succinylbenzoate synthase
VQDAIAGYSKVRGHMMAKAGMEAALWDLFAKSENISLSEKLGGKLRKIEVGVSIGIQPSDCQEISRPVKGIINRTSLSLSLLLIRMAPWMSRKNQVSGLK